MCQHAHQQYKIKNKQTAQKNWYLSLYVVFNVNVIKVSLLLKIIYVIIIIKAWNLGPTLAQ